MAPTPGEGVSQLFDPITLGIIAAIAIAVVVGVLLGYRRGRY
jgi:Na+/citrate or Na+/malate symporter